MDEIILLQEEMRRVLHFLLWQISWWKARFSPTSGHVMPLAEGHQAYAERQIAFLRQVADKFKFMWSKL